MLETGKYRTIIPIRWKTNEISPITVLAHCLRRVIKLRYREEEPRQSPGDSQSRSNKAESPRDHRCWGWQHRVPKRTKLHRLRIPDVPLDPAADGSAFACEPHAHPHRHLPTLPCLQQESRPAGLARNPLPLMSALSHFLSTDPLILLVDYKPHLLFF